MLYYVYIFRSRVCIMFCEFINSDCVLYYVYIFRSRVCIMFCEFITSDRVLITACFYGDPHIVTLDGLKYTFNGKGEFTMIETTDNSFTLQGRMEPTLDKDGNPTPGTVFTALAARQHTTNTTVQFELRSSGLRVRVDGKVVEFGDISQVDMGNVTVKDKGNNTIAALFKVGVKMEIKVENGIISVMLVTVPKSLKGKTRGLMGTFNDDPTDDLIPKSEMKAIPSNSSLQEIHNLFGTTCEYSTLIFNIFRCHEF